jgi:electron transfer flavoprotein alpha subunit
VPGIIINQHRIQDAQALLALCPFGALCLSSDGGLEITAGCKVCKVCVRKGPEGVFEYQDEAVSPVEKNLWRGIAVFAEQVEGQVHPVVLELIGKARQLAALIEQPTYVLLAGSRVGNQAEELLHFGVDEVFLYDQLPLENFLIEPYAAVFEDFIQRVKPSTVLVGGTPLGRSLAPRVAARFRTGLTADCTSLEMQPNSDLDQIRPAFGGNIMAHIRTPNHRPQFATVRYKMFAAQERQDTPAGKVTVCEVSPERLFSRIRVASIHRKLPAQKLEDAEVIVVAGRGIRRESDLEWVRGLAESLGGQVAATRPLIEAGWVDSRCQIGLSGRTVKPRLIITCGVSGAIQFVAGMKNSDCIISINTDADAPIMKLAHYALVGDLYQILPLLMDQLANHHRTDGEGIMVQ